MHKAYKRLLRDTVYLLDRAGLNEYGSPQFSGPGTGPLRGRVRYQAERVQNGNGEEVVAAGTVTIDHDTLPERTNGAIHLGGDVYHEVIRIHGPKVGAKVDHLKVWFGAPLDLSQVQAA